MSTVVLVIDDEKELRELTRRFLKSKGFTVYLAANGAEGVAVFKEHLEEISVVLTDIHLRLMNGLEMIDQLLRLKPALRVVILASPCPGEYSIPGTVQLFNKPCSWDDLLHSIQS